IYDSPAWTALVTALRLNIVADADADALQKHSAIAQALVLPQINTLLPLLSDAHNLYVGVIQAELYIAQALENGQSLTEGGAEWEQKTAALIALQAKNRRQIKVFNTHQALTGPEQFCKILSDMLTLSHFTPQAFNHSLQLLAA